NVGLEWDRVHEQTPENQISDGSANSMRPGFSNEQMQRLLAVRKYMDGDLAGAWAAWRAQSREPQGPIELAVVANAMAAQGDENAVKYIDQLRQFQPVEADVVLGRLRIRQGKTEAGT